MGNLIITPTLKGKFGEICFEEFSDQRNYAYIHSREIWQTMQENNNELFFRHKFEIIKTFLPWSIVSEVYALSRPSNLNMIKNREVIREPSFVCDYLTVSLKNFERDNRGLHYRTKPVPLEDLNWVEVKFGKGDLTKNQRDILDKTNIPAWVFLVKGEIHSDISVRYHPKYH